MTRLSIVAVAFVCLGLGVFLLPALSQTPNKPVPSVASIAKPNDAMAAVLRLLKQPINVRPLQADTVKLSEALDFLFKATGNKVGILVDRAAFADGVEAVANLYDQEVKLPSGPESMPFELALRLIVAQATYGQGAFWIHASGFIEITHTRRMHVRYWLYESSILANFEQRPLRDVLNDLSNRTGAPIYLDPDIGKASEMQITALFNNNTLEQAVVVVTEMAHLKYVVLERGILVTTPENAKVVAAEEEKRAAAREAFQKARERLIEKPGA